MIANEMRRDSAAIINNENIILILDTFHDRRNGFVFMVNALGGMRDEQISDEANPNIDWNGVWSSGARRFEQGWTAEIAIPFKSLRYNPGASQIWGVNLERTIRWKNERVYLAPMPASYGPPAIWKVSLAADLVGLEAPPTGKNLEVKPYGIAGITTDRRASVSNRLDRDAGFDVKYGVTKALTADFTLNTDFAQVEDDEQQVNLTRFSLFFPEKREFFLEGQGVFNFGGVASPRSGQAAGDAPALFFSRQIGINAGRAVPIIGGGRVTGKAGPFSVGVLNIQTDEESASQALAANFSVLRLRRDVLRKSAVGAMYTRRSVALDGGGSNEAFGIDGVFAFYENVRLNTYLARTRTPGVTGDDGSYRTQLEYYADRYGVQLERLSVGEHFNPEMGFMRRRNFAKSLANVRFSPRPAGRQAVRKYYYEFDYSYFTNGTGRLESRAAQAAFRIEFQNSDRINVEHVRMYELLEAPFPISSNVTIPVGGYGFDETLLSYQLGQQRKVSGTPTLTFGRFYGGRQTAALYRGRVEVTPRLTFEPSISLNWVDLPQGEFLSNVVSTRVTSTLTPRMFVGALVQYNSNINAFSNNVRFRWEYLPGSELFVVYSEGRDTRPRGFPELDNRAFVVKINRLFRL
jgi:hypothetical protein